ncbi:MAG: hypothetical protein HFJ09_16155 [Lachnospiraceae bacterium]|nr:hypothetical protein [Lachnospiraceae bacterium]
MKIENIGNGYLRVTFYQEGMIDEKKLGDMKLLECILPFQRDKDVKQSMLYHVGNYIPLVEYLNKKVLDLEETKGIFLSCINSFERITESGLFAGNLITELHHIYVEPVTQELRFIYCPVTFELDGENFQNMLRDIVFVMKTQGAELLLGTVLADFWRTNRNDRNYEKWKKCIYQIEDNIQVIEKKVEVDRILERTIVRTVDKKQYPLGYLVVYNTLSLFLLVVAPMLLAERLSGDLVTRPGLVNILLCFCNILLSVILTIWMNRRKTTDRTIITTEPKKKQETEEKVTGEWKE